MFHYVVELVQLHQHQTSTDQPSPRRGIHAGLLSKVEGGRVTLEAGRRGCRLSLCRVEDVRQPATLTHSCFPLPLFLLLFLPSLHDLRFPPKHIFDFI